MSSELSDLLNATAIEPSGPPDLAHIQARGRRRRRIRHGAAATGTAALIALATVIGIDVLVPETEQPQIADQPERTDDATRDDTTSEEPADDDGRPADDRPDDQAPANGLDVDTGEVPTIELGEAGWPLLVAGESGVVRIDGSTREQLTDTPAITALSDLQHGVVIQDAEGGDRQAGAIRWLPADGNEQTLATTDQSPVLHAVVERQGEPTVLFTRRSGERDQEVETLHAMGMDGEAQEEQLGVTGQLESELGGVGLVGDDLVLMTCHLECRLLRVPWGQDPDGPEAVELHPELPTALHGLTAQHDQVAAVYQSQVQLDDDSGPLLWLDIGEEEIRELPLPGPEQPEAWTATVDLAPDATAAVITYHRYDHPDVQALLVDRLTHDQPTFAWLDTDQRVRIAR